MAQEQTRKLSYAQTVLEANTPKIKTNKQRVKQNSGSSVKVMLRQILNNQEILKKRLINLENKVKMFTSKIDG